MANEDVLVKVGADISSYSREMGKASKELGSFTERNAETFSAFKKVGSAVTGAGLALSTGLGFAVKTAADFESGMSQVSAVSGAVGDDLQALENRARELGASTSFSAKEASEGLQYLALAGWDTTQMIDGLEPVLHLAEAGALDLGRSADLVTDSMAGLGLGVQDLDEYLDKVAQTSRNSNTDIDALMEAFVIAGGTFDRLNIPLSESNAFLGVLANRGFKASEAGTAINAIMTRLTQSSGPAADALEEIGVNAFDSEGNFRGMETVMRDVEKAMGTMTDAEKAHYQQQIAGLNHGKTFSAMLSGLGDEYDDLKESVVDSDGALLEMRDTMKDNLQGALENLSSAFEEILITLGTTLLPIVEKATEWLQKLADWFNNLSDETKETIAIVTAIAAALALVVGPIMMLIGVIPATIAGFKAIGVGLAAVFCVPGQIVAAIVAIAIVIYKYWDEIKEFTIAAWDAIKDFFVDLWNTITEFLTETWESITTFLSETWETIKTIAVELWTSIIDGIMTVVEPIIEWITEGFELISDNLSEIFEGIKEYFSAVWELIKNIFLGAILLIVNLVTGDFEELKENAIAIWENIKEALDDAWEAIKKIFSNALEAIKTTFSRAWEKLKELGSAGIEKIKDVIKRVWNSVKTFFTETLFEIRAEFIKKLIEIKDAIFERMSDAKDSIKNIWNEAVDFLKNIDLWQLGKDAIQGFVNGIKNMGKRSEEH